MTTLTEIEAAADALPKEQKEQLLGFLAAKLGRKLEVIDLASGSVRRAGLHAGAWEVAQDFDAALPDEFTIPNSPAIRWRCFGKMEYIPGPRRPRSADLPNDRTTAQLCTLNCVRAWRRKWKAGTGGVD